MLKFWFAEQSAAFQRSIDIVYHVLDVLVDAVYFQSRCICVCNG